MKKIFLLILFVELINLYISIVPTWNLEKSSIDLFTESNEHSYDICNRFMYFLTVRLEKKFTKNEDSSIKQKNIIHINNTEIGEVIWEDIESFYTINNKPYICPRGKYFMNVYKDSKFEELIPDDFAENENWDLMCYYQEKPGYMFVGFINKHPILYSYKISDGTWNKLSYFNDGLYDFKWVTSPVDNDKYPMKAIVLKDNMITLKGILFTINQENGDINVEEKLEKSFTKIKSYSNSFFYHENEHFYFMTYNNVTDFTSGFYNAANEISSDKIDEIEPIINNLTPLEFFEDVNIVYIKFIQNTQYLYYKIESNDNKVTYHGIIDIEKNKVIFNTDEEIIEFKPYSKNSMLAITKKSAYKVCTIQDNNNQCIDECSSGIITYDTQKPNQCNNEIQCDNFILMNNEICIESCDENIFTLKGEKNCGLCRDLDDDQPYKLINASGCLSDIPENAQLVNPLLYLLSCKERYTLKEGNCILQCYELCQTCESYSEDINDQKCTSCANENQVLQEGNCIDVCSEGYYESEKKCLKCGDFCKTCENKDKCEICYNGYYLNENVCTKCSDNCDTCSKGPEANGNQNCLTCKQDSIYKYLINDDNNHSCVDKCPEGTFLDEENICQKCGDFCKSCTNSNICDTCNDGYYLDENICKKCSDNCETCSKGPEENGNQNCLKCKQDSIYKYLINDQNNHTCVEKCPESTFLDEEKNICDFCSEFCQICQNSDKCDICYYGYYLDENKCKKCSENCETCSKGPEENGNQNCIFCNQNTIYKYLINDENNRTCVDICPKNTYLEQKNKTCIYKNTKVSKKKSKWYIFWIIFIIIIILLILIICFYRKYRQKRITSDEIEGINENKNKSIH